MLFITSDTHFNHKNIIKYSNRPFELSKSGVNYMNEYIIKQWNSVVKETDDVLHIGDFAIGNDIENFDSKKEFYKNILSRLNGHKILIRGNHDHETEDFYKYIGFEHVFDYVINDGFFINHYPLEINEEYMKPELITHIKKLQGIYNKSECKGLIHGHSHNFIYKDKRFFNVSVETNDYKPYEFIKIKNEFKRLDNKFKKFNIKE
jgi:calcineurin-like phosphoesterase family protein